MPRKKKKTPVIPRKYKRQVMPGENLFQTDSQNVEISTPEPVTSFVPQQKISSIFFAEMQAETETSEIPRDNFAQELQIYSAFLQNLEEEIDVESKEEKSKENFLAKKEEPKESFPIVESSSSDSIEAKREVKSKKRVRSDQISGVFANFGNQK